MRVRRLNAPHTAKKAAKITPFLAHVKILTSQLTGLLVLAQMLGRSGLLVQVPEFQEHEVVNVKSNPIRVIPQSMKSKPVASDALSVNARPTAQEGEKTLPVNLFLFSFSHEMFHLKIEVFLVNNFVVLALE